MILHLSAVSCNYCLAEYIIVAQGPMHDKLGTLLVGGTNTAQNVSEKHYHELKGPVIVQILPGTSVQTLMRFSQDKRRSGNPIGMRNFFGF